MVKLDTTIASVIVRKDGADEENLTANGVRIPLFRKSTEYIWSGAANLDSNFHLISAAPYLFLEPLGELVEAASVVIEWSITVLRNKYKNTHVGRSVLQITDNLPTQHKLIDVLPDQLNCGDVIVITAKRVGSDVEDTAPLDMQGLGLFIASN